MANRVSISSRRRRGPTPEACVKKAITDWLDVHRIPWLRLNAGSVPIREGGNARYFQGVRKGTPDLVAFPSWGGVGPWEHSDSWGAPRWPLFIEVKAGKNDLSDVQVEWHKWAKDNKIAVVTARSVDGVELAIYAGAPR